MVLLADWQNTWPNGPKTCPYTQKAWYEEQKTWHDRRWSQWHKMAWQKTSSTGLKTLPNEQKTWRKVPKTCYNGQKQWPHGPKTWPKGLKARCKGQDTRPNVNRIVEYCKNAITLQLTSCFIVFRCVDRLRVSFLLFLLSFSADLGLYYEV